MNELELTMFGSACVQTQLNNDSYRQSMLHGHGHTGMDTTREHMTNS